MSAPGQSGHIVATEGVTIYYELYGQGEPLILLHAGSLTGGMWEPYLAAFAGRYRVVVPDLPGHGRSGHSTRAMSYRHLADDIAAFLQALDLRNPLIAGFSDGGQVALEIGMRYPTLPRAMAIGGVVIKYGDGVRAFVRSALGDDSSTEIDTTLLARNHPDWAAWLDQLYGVDGWKPLLTELKQMWITPLNYTTADFAAVSAPTLVMIGDRDELVPVEEAAELYHYLPTAELAVVPNAHHGAFFSEKVTTFQLLMMDFLARHSAE